MSAEASDEIQYARSASPTSLPVEEEVDLARGRLFRASNPEDAVQAGIASAELFYESSYESVLASMVEWVVSHEGPVLDAVLARRIARVHGFQRTGSRIQERIERIAEKGFSKTEESAGAFYWPTGVAPGSEAAFRWPADDENSRGVEEICEQELVSLAKWVVASGKSGEEALVAMAREVGLQKLRAASRSRLEQALAAGQPEPPLS